MKNNIFFLAVVLTLGLGGCEKKSEVAAPAVITVPVPGPAGATGATGEAGYTGATGSTGAEGQKGSEGSPGEPGEKTVIVVPPASSSPQR